MKKTYKILSAVLAAVLFSTAFTLFPSVKKAETAYAAGNITHENSAQTARSIANEGTVLLRNTGALPLKRSDRVAMCGSEKTIFGGGGSGWVNTTEKISYSDGMTAASSAGKIKSFSVKNFGSVAGSDKVLYVISRETTENADRSRSSFYLTATEKNELSDVCSAVGSANVIVLLNVGSVVDTTWLIEKNVGAIVACYFGGSVAGESLAAVLCGEVSPSGKTSDTWAKSLDDYPSESVGTFGQQNIVKYTEDIYAGYRWFETFDKNYEKVNYEFGYGLSYTKFEISERKAEVTDGKVVASATVKNVGSYSGKEVLQVYYSAPQGEFGTPSKQLGAFVKTHTLAPGQAQTVTCSFPIENMAVFDDLGKVAANSGVLLSGEYSFYLGNSVKNAGFAGVAGKYNQTENKVIKTLSALPDSTLDFRLTASGSMEKISDAEDVAMGAITVNALGATVIQAEEYSDKSGSSSLEAYVSGTTTGKGIGNLNRNDGFLEYKLNVEKAGEYNILFAMATQYDNQIDMFTVTVDKQRQPVVASLAARTHDESDGMWFKCLPIKSGANKITLPKGECTLRFSSNGLKFQNIDFFVIYNDNVGEGKAAFNAAVGTSSTGVIHGADKFVTGYSGKAGNRYTFTVNAETAGEYDLSVAASNLSKASESALKVLVGDNNVGNIPLKRTSVAPDVALENNKFVCAQSDSLVVTLAKGENVITLETEDTALGCLETLYVEKTDGNRIHTGNYSDNTAEFDGKTPSLEGKKLDKVITYNDVLFDPSLMDDFVSQLSVIDLIYMHGTDAKNQTGEINTGGVGGYKVTSKYKIPNAYTADGPAGIRVASSATWFPCMTMLACTWNTELAETFGMQVGFEANAVGVNVWLAPGVNIHRNPQCGRNFEYFSEDPLLAGKMGAAVTRGAQSTGVSVCVKHYAVNNQENGRYVYDARVSNRALREIYLKPFEIAIKEGGAYAVMSSYNMCNGTYVSANRVLITDVLRTDWGFKGAVFGDWNPSYPHIPLVASGNNFKSFNAEYSNLIAAYKSRIITREQLESNVKTALKFLMLTNCNKQQVFAVDESIEISAANTAASSVGDGKLKRMYRFYIRNEGKYSLDVVGLKEGVAVALDGTEVSGKTDNVTMSLGLHELIVSGDITSVNALEKIVINAAFCQGDSHSWGEWQVIKNETCVQPGTKERVCSVCGKTESEEIAPNGKHNYENGRCTVCSALQPGVSHEHIFGEWTVVKQATCLEKGERTRVCDCGARETESTPLALHDYKDGVCSVCGDKKPGGGENNSVPTGGCRSAGNTLPAMLMVCAMLVIAYLPMRKK